MLRSESGQVRQEEPEGKEQNRPWGHRLAASLRRAGVHAGSGSGFVRTEGNGRVFSWSFMKVSSVSGAGLSSEHSNLTAALMPPGPGLEEGRWTTIVICGRIAEIRSELPAKRRCPRRQMVQELTSSPWIPSPPSLTWQRCLQPLDVSVVER